MTHYTHASERMNAFVVVFFCLLFLAEICQLNHRACVTCSQQHRNKGLLNQLHNFDLMKLILLYFFSKHKIIMS